jgi:uncharacterized protein (TIGR02996 family)
MNEEAGFIAALLADPDDRTVLLVYADWLDERDDPRGAYLRAVASAHPDHQQLAQLGQNIDVHWVRVIMSRRFRVGTRVMVLSGAFAQSEAAIVTIHENREGAIIQLTFWGRPVDVDVTFEHLALIEQPAA